MIRPQGTLYGSAIPSVLNKIGLGGNRRRSHRRGGVSMSIAVCYEDKSNKQRGVPSLRECHCADAFNIVMQVTFVTEYKW